MNCIIFDLDGTLIETEQVWRDVRREFVLSHGGRWHESAQETMIGMRTGENTFRSLPVRKRRWNASRGAFD